MQIVIDINDYEYEKIKEDAEKFRSKGMVVPHLYKVIESGIPLPKGHGDLIDTNELNNFCKEHDVGINAINRELIYDAGETSRGDTIWKPLLEVLSTIIEADK